MHWKKSSVMSRHITGRYRWAYSGLDWIDLYQQTNLFWIRIYRNIYCPCTIGPLVYWSKDRKSHGFLPNIQSVLQYMDLSYIGVSIEYLAIVSNISCLSVPTYFDDILQPVCVKPFSKPVIKYVPPCGVQLAGCMSQNIVHTNVWVWVPSLNDIFKGNISKTYELLWNNDYCPVGVVFIPVNVCSYLRAWVRQIKLSISLSFLSL